MDDFNWILQIVYWAAIIFFWYFGVLIVLGIVSWPYYRGQSLIKFLFGFIASFFESPEEEQDVAEIFEYGAIDRVIDGDTIIFNGRRVRILHVDAPEIGQNLTHDSSVDAGIAARDMMALYAIRREARLRLEGTDSFGRILARVYVSGEDLGLKLVRAGYAIALAGAPDEYAQAQKTAQSSKRGLWNMGGFEHPADWRKANARADNPEAAAA